MNIGFDSIAILGPLSKNRGIGNYGIGLLNRLIADHLQDRFSCLNLFDESVIGKYLNYSENLQEVRLYSGACDVLLDHEEYKEITGDIVRRFIDDNHIDVFLITSPFDGHVFPYEKEWFSGIKVAAIVYDIIPYVFKSHYLPSELDKEFYKRRVDMLRWCNRLLVISQSVKDDLISYLGFDGEKIDVIWGAANGWIRKTAFPVEKISEVLEKFGLEEKKYFMCTGGDDERKNLARLIEAYGKTSENIRSSYKLAIVCKLQKQSEERYHALADEFGIGEQVVLTNYVSDEELLVLYNTAYAMVFPSVYEGFGLPVVEAFACDLPVLTSNNSSLCQIGGDAVVQVDPYSAEEIARGMERLVVEDNKGRILKGRERNALFCWENVARATYSAFEKLAKIPEAELPRIAFFTPLPPLQSGIADYSEDILKEISGYFLIDVFIDDGYEVSCSFPDNVRVLNHRSYRESDYFRTIYQVGNSFYHRYMFSYIRKHPGIVVLHDCNLHGVLREMTIYDGAPRLDVYRSMLQEEVNNIPVQNYAETLRSVQDVTPDFYDLYVNAFIVNYASKIIVHSKWTGLQLLHNDIGRDVTVIPHYAKVSEIPDVKKSKEKLGISPDKCVIAAFGFLYNTKRSLPTLKALSRLKCLGYEFAFYFVGSNIMAETDKRVFEDYIRENGMEDSVMVTGYTDLELFNHYMDAADICLNLRYPYNGESSGSLMRLLAKGKCVVVNDIGSFGEFPDSVCVKLPNVGTLSEQEEIFNIYRALKKLMEHPEFVKTTGKNAHKYAREYLSLENVGKKYRDVILSRGMISGFSEPLLKNFSQQEIRNKKYQDILIRRTVDTFAYIKGESFR